MKNHSPFQIILISVFGAFAVAAILVFAFAVGGNQSGAGIGKVVIWGALDKSAFDAMLQTAQQADQDLDGVSYVQKPAANFNQTLTEALAQKSGPDLFVLSSDYAWKDAPLVSPIPYADLSQTQFQTLFAQSANVYLGASGVVGVPFAVDPLVLYWNRDLLQSAGFAQPPSTWEQLQQMAPVLTVIDQTGTVTTSAIAIGTYQNVDDAQAILSALFLQKGVPVTTVSSQGQLSAALSAAQAGGSGDPSGDALAFYTSFADPSQPQYSWNGSLPDARSAFAAGNAAFYVGFASEDPAIRAMNPNLDFAVAPLPQFSGSRASVDFARVYAYAVPQASANPSGAFQAAELLDSATTTANLAQLLGIAAARRDALSLPLQGDPQTFQQMAIIARSWADPDPAQTAPLFQAMIENTISGQAPAAQAVESGDQQLSQIINPQQ